ncbi:hypothetical protein BS47DRAFT_1490027 [Hydnum rufescens UP504]|uniref:Secreted protein n=1 Tax=Hydnum rufescens UP504 TaxID=1448309 RepID=A0A9P6AFR9_9AGAM|nr:hypothetical protein BS47DRAFT_1490027 [Hydnum rufescens UP504]
MSCEGYWMVKSVMALLFFCILDSGCMGKASPLWKYFTKLQEQYGANKSHPAARCNACIAHFKLELERDDLNRITLGDLVQLHRASHLTTQVSACLN